MGRLLFCLAKARVWQLTQEEQRWQEGEKKEGKVLEGEGQEGEGLEREGQEGEVLEQRGTKEEQMEARREVLGLQLRARKMIQGFTL